MDDARDDPMLWVAVGGLVPIAAAFTLVPLRDAMVHTNVALVLVAVVVLVAVAGGRVAGATAAVFAAVSFDFFFTHPYLHLRIATGEDVETTVLLLVVGLVVGHVAARGRRARISAAARLGEVRRIYRVAELAANGDEPSDVVMATQAELTDLLRLEECRFEAPPFDTTFDVLERTGVVPSREHRWYHGGFELPRDGVELRVLGRGHVLGRFVLTPTPDTGVSLEERVVAVALADQVGAVLAAAQSRRETDG